MTFFTRFKRFLTPREPSPPDRPLAPLEIVDGEIALCRSRIEDARAVLENLERRAIKAVRAGQDEAARRVLAEVSSLQAHIIAEQAALREFEAQRANLHSVLAR